MDLEGLAKHKGSVLGLWYKEKQPTQKYFESLLVSQLRLFDENKVVWLESESIRIGNITIPHMVFQQICKSDRYVINLPLTERVKHIIQDYDYFTTDFDAAKEQLLRLSRFQPTGTVDRWTSLGEERKWEELVEDLLINHYDPTYTKSQTDNNHSANTTHVDIDSLSPLSVSKCLQKIVGNTTVF